MPDTHTRCKELLEQTGLSVSQSLVLCLRNAFDITIRQTISPCLVKEGRKGFSSYNYASCYKWNGV